MAVKANYYNMAMASLLQRWFVCMCLGSSLSLGGSHNQADRLWRLMINSRGSQKLSVDDEDLNSFPVDEGSQRESREADKISRLPGQPPVGFNQYSGYVTVNAKTERALFYYFVESPQAAHRKPLVLWLNGGPACSSLAYGAMTELGPFRVNSDGQTLFENPYAWNKVANVIFLESPISVGFSYSNTTLDYKKLGDRQTAKDTYVFLLEWLERFPYYKNRDFFLTGESYAGHYVPQLANYILHQNEKKKHVLNVNFKGIAIGNPWMDDSTNQMGVFDYLLSHALISDETHKNLIAYCLKSSDSMSKECLPYYEKAFHVEVGNINLFNIYYPLCHNVTRKRGSVTYFDPCSNNYVDSYLNRPKVQKALHAKPTSWSACSKEEWNDWQKSILPIIKKLMANDLLVWIYSGDVDSDVPYTSSKYSIDTLNLTIVEPWRPWYSKNEVGGYVIKYKGLTFATVKGAGHEVPSYRPREALILISAFLQGHPLPLPPSRKK